MFPKFPNMRVHSELKILPIAHNFSKLLQFTFGKIVGKLFSSWCTLDLLGQCGRTTWPTVTYGASLDVHKKIDPENWSYSGDY